MVANSNNGRFALSMKQGVTLIVLNQFKTYENRLVSVIM